MNNRELLSFIRDSIIGTFGNIVDRIILFGSRTMGDEKPYSDYDILIILTIDYDWRKENAIRDVCYDICLQYDVIMDIKIISTRELTTIKGKQPFILNAIETGISL